MNDYDSYDAITPDGKRIEVNCSAEIQRWPQKAPSRIILGHWASQRIRLREVRVYGRSAPSLRHLYLGMPPPQRQRYGRSNRVVAVELLHRPDRPYQRGVSDVEDSVAISASDTLLAHSGGLRRSRRRDTVNSCTTP